MNCPTCAHDAFDVRYQLSTYRVVRCRQCDVSYNRDFPEPDGLADTFNEHYYREVQREAFAHVGGSNGKADASRAIYERGLSLIGGPAGRGSLLDIGCAFGVFMELARTHGWSVKGVEISPYSSRYAREDRGLDVFTGDVAMAPLAPGAFDAVTLWDVLEHVRDARGTLARVRELLKPGGHVLITTDNFDGLIARLGGTLYRLTLGRAAYPVERFYIPYNSWYPTPGAMRRVLTDAGFEVLAVTGIDYPIGKINLSAADAVVVRALYTAGELTGMTSQTLIAARRR